MNTSKNLGQSLSLVLLMAIGCIGLVVVMAIGTQGL